MEILENKTLNNFLVSEARRKRISVSYEKYEITNKIENSIINCKYSDAINELDSIQLTLDDRDDLWLFKWAPVKGEIIDLSYTLHNWEKENTVIERKIGKYYVDTIGYFGPPFSVEFKAISVDIKSPLLDTRRNKTWMNITFKKIAETIARNSGLTLSYNVEITRDYDRLEQREESDFGFLKNLAQELEVNVKLHEGTLVLWEESLMEKQEPSHIIKRAECQNYFFDISDTEIYKSCEIKYHDYKKNEVITSTYTLEKQKLYKYDNERTLVIIQNRSPKGKNKAEKEKNLKKLAAKELKKKNNSALTGRLNILGRSVPFYSGSTIKIEGFGTLDGKYLIKSVDTDLKTYNSTLSIRACNYEEYEDA